MSKANQGIDGQLSFYFLKRAHFSHWDNQDNADDGS